MDNSEKMAVVVLIGAIASIISTVEIRCNAEYFQNKIFKEKYEPYKSKLLKLTPAQLGDKNLVTSMTALVTDGEEFFYKTLEFKVKKSIYIFEARIKNNENGSLKGVGFNEGDILSYDELDNVKRKAHQTLKSHIALKARVDFMTESGCYDASDIELAKSKHIKNVILNKEVVTYKYTYNDILRGRDEDVYPNYFCLFNLDAP